MVEILETSFVVPAANTPVGTFVLSNFDCFLVRKPNDSIYLFKNTVGAEDFMSAEVLKSALAKALVLLYPLAGRHVVGHDGRDHINCSAEGVLFVVARLNQNADSIQFEPMSQELRELFVPEERPSLLQMLQVTYLKCGSVVLGSSNSHIILDGRSAAHFYQTWSAIARRDEESIVPFNFDNTPLRPRFPLRISFDFPEYTSDPPKIRDTTPISDCVLSIMRLTKEQISQLKIQCSQDSKSTRVTTFSAVSALAWKCYCIAQGLPPDAKSRLIFTADVRNRLNPPLKSYIGNAAVRMSATSRVSKITSHPIAYAASKVRAATDVLTDEYVRSFIDFLQAIRGKKISKTPISESDLRVRSMLGMQINEVDFGWGVPQLLSLERCTESRVIYLMNEPGKDGCIKVVAALQSSIMAQFKKVFYEELLCFQQPA